MSKESVIEHYSLEAVNMVASGDLSLTDAIVKVANENGIDNDNILAEMCARTNHIVMAKLAAVDPLATFKIAKIDDVVNGRMKGLGTQKDIHRQVNILIDPPFYESPQSQEKVASVKDKENATPLECLVFSEEQIKIARESLEKLATDSLKVESEVEELLKSGEDPESIKALLLDVWGDEKEEEIDAVLAKHVSPGTKIDPKEVNEYRRKEQTDSGLSEKAASVLENKNRFEESYSLAKVAHKEAGLKTIRAFQNRQELENLGKSKDYLPSVL